MTTATPTHDLVLVRERNTAIAALRVLRARLMELSTELVTATSTVRVNDIIDVTALYPTMPAAVVEFIHIDSEDRRGFSGVTIRFVRKDGTLANRKVQILQRHSKSANHPLNGFKVVGKLMDDGTMDMFATTTSDVA